MGDVCEEWLICDLAAQSLGAIVYGIYPTAAPTEVEYQMRDGGAAIFIAEDQEYVDKILPLIDRLPDVRAIVTIDASAMFGYDHPKLMSYKALVAGAEARPGLARGARRGDQAGRPGLHRLHLGHHRQSEGRADRARQASRRRRDRLGPLSDALREGAPHGRLPAALPRARARRRGDLAAVHAARAAFRRGPGGSRRDLVRDRADGAVHRAALSAEIRRAGSGRDHELVEGQARQLRAGDALRARACAAALERRGERRAGDRLPGVARGGVPPDPEQARLRPARAGGERRRAAADRDDGAVAHLRRQRRRDVRPDRRRGRHHRGPARAVPASGHCRHRAGRLGREARRRRRGAGAQRRSVRGLLERSRRPPRRSRPTTATGTPATSANGATAICAWSIARATLSSRPAARPSRPRRSRTCCAPRPTSPRRS